MCFTHVPKAAYVISQSWTVAHFCSRVTEWFCVISSWTVNAYGTNPHRQSRQAPNNYNNTWCVSAF